MERVAARMGGTIKWPFNESECLDADYFKIVADALVTSAGVRPLLHAVVVDVILESGASTTTHEASSQPCGRLQRASEAPACPRPCVRDARQLAAWSSRANRGGRR